jgi:AcrR family transcriptional regulator
MGTVEMVHEERRRRAQQALRNRILDAARELFADLGYEAVTMRRIAEKIEYSPTTIYLHFSDKAALVRELCSVDFLSLAASFRAIGAERDPIARIQAIGRAYVDFALAHPNQYRLMFMTAHPPVPEEERKITKGSLDEDAWAMLVSAVSDAQRAGALQSAAGDASALAQQFFAGVHGVVALHLAKANDPWIGWAPVREATERMMEALIRGFAFSSSLPPPGKPARR